MRQSHPERGTRLTISTTSLQGEAASATGERRVDVLAAELAAEARRRTEADAIVEELMQYNTAVIEQAQVRPLSTPWHPCAGCSYINESA
jgi:hypothetical protein